MIKFLNDMVGACFIIAIVCFIISLVCQYLGEYFDNDDNFNDNDIITYE